MATASKSILNTTKKVLGLDPEYDVYDEDLILHINSTFATLHQLGVGPDRPFEIEDDLATWENFLGDSRHINSVKTYVVQKVRLIFDPPGTSFHLTAIQEQIKEAEWRLNVADDNYITETGE